MQGCLMPVQLYRILPGMGVDVCQEYFFAILSNGRVDGSFTRWIFHAAWFPAYILIGAN